VSEQSLQSPEQEAISYLIPPNIDLDHVSRYNAHGQKLAELLGDMPVLHHPLILGLFAVYSLLIKLGNLNEDEVSFPPHDDFCPENWLGIGFTQEVVDILELLPYAHRETGERASIAPWTPAISYLGGGDPDVRGPDPIREYNPSRALLPCLGMVSRLQLRLQQHRWLVLSSTPFDISNIRHTT
jgi:hypothetical protein